MMYIQQPMSPDSYGCGHCPRIRSCHQDLETHFKTNTVDLRKCCSDIRLLIKRPRSHIHTPFRPYMWAYLRLHKSLCSERRYENIYQNYDEAFKNTTITLTQKIHSESMIHISCQIRGLPITLAIKQVTITNINHISVGLLEMKTQSYEYYFYVYKTMFNISIAYIIIIAIH